jgi:ABC-type oligopeptide transport system ATPase subunit
MLTLPEQTLDDEKSQSTLLRVQDLHKHFSTPLGLGEFFKRNRRKVIRAVDGVSFEIPRGSTFGLVGESGCGKTTTSKVILGLYKPTSGSVYFEGNNVHQRKIPLPRSTRG